MLEPGGRRGGVQVVPLSQQISSPLAPSKERQVSSQGGLQAPTVPPATMVPRQISPAAQQTNWMFSPVKPPAGSISSKQPSLTQQPPKVAPPLEAPRHGSPLGQQTKPGSPPRRAARLVKQPVSPAAQHPPCV